MKKIGIIIFIILIVIITCISDYYKNKEKIKNEASKKLNCVNFTGGSFKVYFNTNGGEEISTISVGIACSPDSYEDLPIPVREGYTFDGWYYNKKLTNKVSSTSTLDISPIEDLDKDGCLIGYKDINLYAKWIGDKNE